MSEVIAALVDAASALLLAAGAFFYLVGIIGLNRMPDLFTRMHATSVSDTLGLSLMLFGMLLQAGFTLVAFKIIVIFGLIMLTAPIASHALARAAMHDGDQPLLSRPDGSLAETDPVTLFPELDERINTPLSSESLTLPEDAGYPPDDPSTADGDGDEREGRP